MTRKNLEVKIVLKCSLCQCREAQLATARLRGGAQPQLALHLGLSLFKMTYRLTGVPTFKLNFVVFLCFFRLSPNNYENIIVKLLRNQGNFFKRHKNQSYSSENLGLTRKKHTETESELSY